MYEQKALQVAEKHGIIEYQVKGNEMIYFEKWSDGTWKCVIDLNTMKEIRTLN